MIGLLSCCIQVQVGPRATFRDNARGAAQTKQNSVHNYQHMTPPILHGAAGSSSSSSSSSFYGNQPAAAALATHNVSGGHVSAILFGCDDVSFRAIVNS
jgi:hypothetical protein